MSLLYLSLRGGLLIAAIALVRLLLAQRLPRRAYLLLWALAVAVLLLPIRVSARTSIYNLLPAATPISAVESRSEEFSAPAPLPSPAALPDVTPGSAAADAAAARPVDWLRLCHLIGAALCGLSLLFLHLKNLRAFRRAVAVTDCPLPLPERVRLAALDGLGAPLTYGLLRPVILLPASFDRRDTRRLRHVLTHELSHIRNLDLLFKPVLLAACCVHWFNPLCWLMFFLASQDMEMRCDADVLRRLGAGERLSYAKTLVAAEEMRLGGLLRTGFSYSSTGARLKQLGKKPPRPVLSALATVLVVGLLLSVFATDSLPAAASAPQQAPPVTEATVPAPTDADAPLPAAEIPASEPTQPQEVPESAEPTEASSEPVTEAPTEASQPAAEAAPPAYDPLTDVGGLSVQPGTPEQLDPPTESTPRITLTVGQSYDLSMAGYDWTLVYYSTDASVVRLLNDSSGRYTASGNHVAFVGESVGTAVIYFWQPAEPFLHYRAAAVVSVVAAASAPSSASEPDPEPETEPEPEPTLPSPQDWIVPIAPLPTEP